jgi:DNA-binding response OmpR family regulator
MNKTILIVDDDERLNDLLKKYFAQFNFKVDCAVHPDQCFKYLKNKMPDIIILDIMLPDMNGFDVCRKIREKCKKIPIVMLTARGDVSDRIVGLELGADDYIPKPFEPRELLARIQAVLRRRTNQSEIKDLTKFGNLTVDFNKYTAYLFDKDLNLTTMEFEILSVFIKNTGNVLNRDQIMDKIKGVDWLSFDRSIDVLISRLRQKLNDDPKNPEYIKTVWGIGYIFIGKEV